VRLPPPDSRLARFAYGGAIRLVRAMAAVAARRSLALELPAHFFAPVRVGGPLVAGLAAEIVYDHPLVRARVRAPGPFPRLLVLPAGRALELLPSLERRLGWKEMGEVAPGAATAPEAREGAVVLVPGGALAPEVGDLAEALRAQVARLRRFAVLVDEAGVTLVARTPEAHRFDARTLAEALDAAQALTPAVRLAAAAGPEPAP